MAYRDRLYEHYSSNVMGHSEPLSLADADRWGRSYDTFFSGWLPPAKDAAIIDLACGMGGLLRFFTKRGYLNVQGVDISPEQVAMARHIHNNVAESNVLAYLEDKAECFDLITAIDIIEHLSRDEGIAFLDACHQSLKPGGRLILQTPNMDAPWGLCIRYGDNTHEIGYNTKSLSQLLRLSGFGKTESRETGPVAHGLKSTVRRGLWQALRRWYMFQNIVETGSPGSGVLTRVFLISACKRGRA